MIKVTSKNLSITKLICVSMCVGMGLSCNAFAGGGRVASIFAGNNTKLAADDEPTSEGLQQTLNLNFSPENREKLRKALDEYARSVDQDHEQIEAKRLAMRESIEARFLEADSDADGTVDRQEATEKLPQIARHFSQVDTNQDDVISLDELEEAQSRILERRRVVEAALEAAKLQAAEASNPVVGKTKSKQTANNAKKRAL